MAKKLKIEVANKSSGSLLLELANIEDNVTTLKLNLLKEPLEESSETKGNDFEQLSIVLQALSNKKNVKEILFEGADFSNYSLAQFKKLIDLSPESIIIFNFQDNRLGNDFNTEELIEILKTFNRKKHIKFLNLANNNIFLGREKKEIKQILYAAKGEINIILADNRVHNIYFNSTVNNFNSKTEPKKANNFEEEKEKDHSSINNGL